jgi:hypothetical protein
MVIAGIIIVAGLTVLRHPQDDSKNQDVASAFNEQSLKWYTKTSTAPACKYPHIFDQAPVNIGKIDTVLIPGAYRGCNYKPYGGLDALSTQGNLTVQMSIDATLVKLHKLPVITVQMLPLEL